MYKIKRTQTQKDKLFQLYKKTDYFNDGSLKEIKLAIEFGLSKEDIDKIASTEYTTRQIEQIRIGLQNGLDITPYVDNLYSPLQMREIRWGLEQQLDVSIYNDYLFNWAQMQQIRLGLLHNKFSVNKIDVSVYADYKFDWKQMSKIKLGLLNVVDVSIYAKTEFNWEKMDRIRLKLLRAKRKGNTKGLLTGDKDIDQLMK